MERWVYASMLTIVLLATGCTTPPAYNPFQIRQGDFYLKIKTVAMSPLFIPKWAGGSQTVKSIMEKQIKAGLEEAGFKVIPPEEFAEIWNRLLDQMGGYFDPLTGKMDEAKLNIIQDHARRQTIAKFRIDGLVHPSLRVVLAHVSGFNATWDGTSESIIMGDHYETYTGTIEAMSLFIVFEDANGVELFKNSGGIQLLKKVYWRRTVSVPIADLLADQEKNARALEIVLKPLMEGSTSKQNRSQNKE